MSVNRGASPTRKRDQTLEASFRVVPELSEMESYQKTPSFYNDGDPGSKRAWAAEGGASPLSNDDILEAKSARLSWNAAAAAAKRWGLKGEEEEYYYCGSLSSDGKYFAAVQKRRDSSDNVVVVSGEPVKHEGDKAEKRKSSFLRPPPPLKKVLLEKPVRPFVYENSLDYASDVYAWKKSLQKKYCFYDCLAGQNDITPDMRRTVLKWLVAVNRQFDFTLETWCLTVNALDRFFTVQPMKRECLQLAGLTAFFLSAKQEEVDPPDISELVKLCANAYDRKQFRYMECIILAHLKFDFLAPTASFFLVYMVEVRELTDFWPSWLARNVIEMILCDYELSQFLPCQVALAVFDTFAPIAEAFAADISNARISLRWEECSSETRIELAKEYFALTVDRLLLNDK